MKHLKLRIENQFAFIEFDQPDSKINVLSNAVMLEFKEVLLQLKERKDLKGIFILSAKPDIFIAGADIKEIENMTSSLDGQAKAMAGQEILNLLEDISVPTAALINGACVGGGLELALACDWRIASVGDKVRLGLPEVKLGIIPGFGGTKRLARLVGLRKGLEMIVSGELILAQGAFKIGLVDFLAPQARLTAEAIEFLNRNSHKRKIYQPKLKGLLNIFLDKSFLGRLVLKNQTKKFVLGATRGQYPAALAAVDVVCKNYSTSLKAALSREAKVFGELVVGPVSKNLISVFYLAEKYKKAKWAEAAPGKVKKCAVLGAGVMGGGIAQLFSYYGLTVRMKDLSYAALGRGLRQAKEIYNYAIKKRKLKPAQADFAMALISPTTDYSGFKDADLIVEAVIEDMEIKKKVWREVDGVARADAIFASNTSCLSIAQMGEGVKNKSRLVGMHFFNPVHRMPLIEIIRTRETSEEAVATLVEFSKRIGKTPIVVKDSCGFLINRILIPYLDEAGFILEDGVDFERIDNACVNFGMPMGPFTLIDEIGLDVGYKVALLLEEHFGPRMKVAQSLKDVYNQKWFGKKSGKGFYLHNKKGKIPNKGVYGLLKSKGGTSISNEEIVKRLLCRMINEAAMCLEEKICSEPSDIDIGMIMGTGFPPFRGGLLRYADTIGAEKIIADLERLKNNVSKERFNPCGYLAEISLKKGKFYQA
ncbi:MAG: 3-hydroxyacyl-CoA dehydrogenase NAD-binding domain-containing protein [Candidatus Omnitrophota bacterium]|nr:3-hydroxyacyl-CoA dehydrogenase NAD-binding domain-containing protein [Candidatus Omnitrophota bacterium]